METISIEASNRRKAGVRRQKRSNPRTDMTPMVDLGFLLISFFVITTELSKPRTAPLIMPKDGPETPVGNSDAITVLLSADDNIYYYEGNWKKAFANNTIVKTSLNSSEGLRKVIIEKKQWLDVHNTKEGRNGLMLLIKPTENAAYKNIIDILDEIMINDIRKYAVLKIEPQEIEWLKQQPIASKNE